MIRLYACFAVALGSALTSFFEISVVNALEAQSALSAADLTCERLQSPLGIDNPKPRLSWKVASTRRGNGQTAYQVLVALSESSLADDRGDLWDTGKRVTDETIDIPYAGTPLTTGTRAFWKVRVWDRNGRPSAWSKVAWWEMGLLERSDWKGYWIGMPGSPGSQSAPLFHRDFLTRRTISRARVYIGGLGFYELHLNGRKVGDRVLDPAFTRYDRRVLYATYDVTSFLRSGNNRLGVMLGNGWYNPVVKDAWDFQKAPWRALPKFLLRLRIDYADGTSDDIVSDSSWRFAPGPIVFDSIRAGEDYDARRELPAWDQAEGNTTGWSAAPEVQAPSGLLSAEVMEPERVVETIGAAKVSEPTPGTFVFDFGRNLAGWAQLRVVGPRGTRVVMKFGERLRGDGLLDQTLIAQDLKEGNFQSDAYTLKGSGLETWEPRFTYHGFRYVQVSGFPGSPTRESLRARLVRTDFRSGGRFSSSNPLLHQIDQMTTRSYEANFHGYPTDCPHREKNGWTADGHLAAEQAMYRVDNVAAYEKWMADFKDEQRDSGDLPGIIPTAGYGYEWGNGPAWDSAFLLIPWYLYLYSADRQILIDHFEHQKKYVDYLTSTSRGGLYTHGVGDWMSLDEATANDVTSTAYYYADAKILSDEARILGRDADAKRFALLAAKIRKAFRDHFVNEATGLVANGSQTAQSCAIYYGLLEPVEKLKAVGLLAEDIGRHRGHLDSGMLGAKCLLNALSANGRADTAFRVVSREDYPGWGYMLSSGATTLWEDWSGTRSLDHVALSDVSAWFYQSLAGIRPDPSAPGFKHFTIQPEIIRDLRWVSAESDTVRGPVKVRWSNNTAKLALSIEIPANSSATVWIPAARQSEVLEGGKPASSAEGVKYLLTSGKRVAFEVGSGSYEFSVPSNAAR